MGTVTRSQAPAPSSRSLIDRPLIEQPPPTLECVTIAAVAVARGVGIKVGVGGPSSVQTFVPVPVVQNGWFCRQQTAGDSQSVFLTH